MGRTVQFGTNYLESQLKMQQCKICQFTSIKVNKNS